MVPYAIRISFFAGCFGAATAASAGAAEDHHQAVAEVPDQLARQAEDVTEAAHDALTW